MTIDFRKNVLASAYGGKIYVMVNTKKLLDALESVAYDKDENDILQGLSEIHRQLAKETTPDFDEKGALWDTKSPARGILSDAGRLARKEASKATLLKMAAAHMGQFVYRGQRINNHEEESYDFECSFVVRYEHVKREHTLKLVGPIDASPRFLIAYAFWILAAKFPVRTWRRFGGKKVTCVICKQSFVKTGIGRPREKDICKKHDRNERRRFLRAKRGRRR